MTDIRESDVEARLVTRVEFNGGTAEKFSSPQKANVPDRIVCWPRSPGDSFWKSRDAAMCFVECKAPGKKPSKAQARDHERRRAMGFRVYVVDTYEAVEHFIKSEGYK